MTTSETNTLRDLGEFGLIDLLESTLPASVRASPDLLLGIGDDAAVWTPPPGERLIVTTDSLVEGVHFRLDWTDWRSLGHKSLAVNLSDIAAMGGTPRLAVVSLGLRGDEPLSGLQDLYRGLGELAARHAVLIAGGDVVASPQSLTIHVTAIGATEQGRYLARGAARIGDVIAVSGTLGAAAAGLRLLQEAPESPRRRATTADLLIAAHLRPEPRLALGRALLTAGVSCAMDLSDGLLGDLPKILAASGVAARLDAAAIPVAAAIRALFPEEWLELALRGGEDYELLFTAPPDVFSRVQAAAADLGNTVTAIGEIVPAGAGEPLLRMRGLDGIEREVRAGAFDHFD
ncbi:MAG TPA: thiamine-phosphate kinase [Thermomicrobiales bacterium]